MDGRVFFAFADAVSSVVRCVSAQGVPQWSIDVSHNVSSDPTDTRFLALGQPGADQVWIAATGAGSSIYKVNILRFRGGQLVDSLVMIVGDSLTRPTGIVYAPKARMLYVGIFDHNTLNGAVYQYNMTGSQSLADAAAGPGSGQLNNLFAFSASALYPATPMLIRPRIDSTGAAVEELTLVIAGNLWRFLVTTEVFPLELLQSLTGGECNTHVLAASTSRRSFWYTQCYYGVSPSQVAQLFASTCSAGFFYLPDDTCVACSTGRYQGRVGQSTCISCTPGSYGTDSVPGLWNIDSSRCFACPGGTASAKIGARFSDCVDCSPGRASTGSATCCASCGAGRWTNRTAAIECDLCPADTYNSQLGSDVLSDCIACPSISPNSAPGSTSLSQCGNDACADGLLTDPSGVTPCSLACPPGAFCVRGQLTSCPAGRYNAYSGENSSAACTSCLPGRYASSPGASTCTQCAPGTFASLPNQVQCQLCGLQGGSYSNELGQTSCISCSPLTPNSPAGATSSSQCEPTFCPPGYYTETAGAECQTTCPLGHMCIRGARTPCLPGSYADTTGRFGCTACGAGHFSSQPGGTSISGCQPCPLGSYSTLALTSICTICEAGFTTSAAGQSSSTCVPMSTCSSSAARSALTIDTHGATCPLGLPTSVSSAQYLPSSEILFARLSLFAQQNLTLSGLSDEDLAAAGVSLLATPVRPSGSLRQAVSSAAVGNMDDSGVDTAEPVIVSSGASDTTPLWAVTASSVLFGLSLLPLVGFRLIPSKLAIHIDRFQAGHSNPARFLAGPLSHSTGLRIQFVVCVHGGGSCHLAHLSGSYSRQQQCNTRVRCI